jgi:hypothetical protein
VQDRESECWSWIICGSATDEASKIVKRVADEGGAPVNEVGDRSAIRIDKRLAVAEIGVEQCASSLVEGRSKAVAHRANTVGEAG